MRKEGASTKVNRYTSVNRHSFMSVLKSSWIYLWYWIWLRCSVWISDSSLCDRKKCTSSQNKIKIMIKREEMVSDNQQIKVFNDLKMCNLFMQNGHTITLLISSWWKHLTMMDPSSNQSEYREEDCLHRSIVIQEKISQKLHYCVIKQHWWTVLGQPSLTTIRKMGEG